MEIADAKTWRYNLYEPMLDLGHQVTFFNLAEFCQLYNVKFRSNAYKQVLSNKLYQTLKEEYERNGIDLFFSYLTDLDIEEEVIDSIGNLGIPTCNFSCNNTHQFDIVRTISPYFNYSLHAEKDVAEKFRSIKANPVWFQMAANPKYYYPKNLPYEYDVTFAGMNYARRAHYISQLLNQDINVHCFGPKWISYGSIKQLRKEIKRMTCLAGGMIFPGIEKRYKYSSWVADYDFSKKLIKSNRKMFHGPISDAEMVELFSKSRINLGFLEVYSKNEQGTFIIQQHLHLREFEVPMSGGLYCTNYSEELAEHYIPDQEIIVFRNEHELTSKIRYYLKNLTEADRIRKAGHKRALADHTCQKRLESLFNWIK